MEFLLFCILFGLNRGFLLDNKNTSIPSNEQYVTVSEYYGDKTHTQEELSHTQNEILRVQQDVNKNLNLLASQIQSKLDAFGQKLEKAVQHNDQHSCTCQKRIEEIEQQYLEFKNKSETCQILYREMVENHTQNSLELSKLKQNLQDLQQLKQIKQLQMLHDLQNQTQNLDLEMKTLKGTFSARSQDFIALYNDVQQLDIKGNTFEATVYNNLTQIKQNFDHQLTPVPVVLSACRVYNGASTGVGTLIYPTVKVATGIPDLANFQSTGHFTCQTQGYYLVSSMVETPEGGAHMQIIQNSIVKHQQYVSYQEKSTPGTMMTILKLEQNDQVWIKIERSVKPAQACLQIFKI